MRRRMVAQRQLWSSSATGLRRRAPGRATLWSTKYRPRNDSCRNRHASWGVRRGTRVAGGYHRRRGVRVGEALVRVGVHWIPVGIAAVVWGFVLKSPGTQAGSAEIGLRADRPRISVFGTIHPDIFRLRAPLVSDFIHLVPAARSSSSARLARAFFSRDDIGFGGPLEGLRFGVALGEPGARWQPADLATLLNTPRRICWRGDFGEQPLDQVDPGRRCWCEVQLEARMFGEPSLHLLGLVGLVVVADRMHVEVLGYGPVDLFQETDEFLGAVAMADTRR